jgi:hypothetical protein
LKVREGFVSNSSSSSFVITFDKKRIEKCQHCGRSGSDIIALLKDENDYGDSGLSATGQAEIHKYFAEWYPEEWFTEDDGKKLFDKIKTAEKAGEKVYLIRVDHNNSLYDHIKEGEMDGVRLLWDDGG